MTVASGFARAVSVQCDYPCSATQNAIDRLAAEFGGRGRGWMLDVVRRMTNAELCEKLLVAWSPGDVKLATGHGREVWLASLDRQVAA